MSKRAVQFLEEWVSENMVKPGAGAAIEGRYDRSFMTARSTSALTAFSIAALM